MRDSKFAARQLPLVVTCLLLLAGCSGSGVHTQPGTPAATTTQPASPTPTTDPQATLALQAYDAYRKSSSIALQNPVAKDKQYPPGGNFEKYSFDPELSTTRIFMWALADGGVAYRGIPPTSHINVKAVKLAAPDWPTVVLTDCLSGLDKWNAVDVKTGKKVPTQVGKVPPPYLSTITMIKYQGHWGVQKVDLDKSQTCVP